MGRAARTYGLSVLFVQAYITVGICPLEWGMSDKMNKCILKGRELVPAPLMEWAEWFETADRRIALTRIGHVGVSTVFIGLDHSFGSGPPLYFETMVFRSGSSGELLCKRYSTYDEAEAGHEAIVKRAEAGEFNRAITGGQDGQDIL
ncbi:hypothetical protein LCGC14_2379020 [marine sediment metagenome]|uniref:Uncharacterized protein n=1 Tax=marine sediment metagenome TaxID=412755 RepID=A0A0F9C1H0_9ZZZZ